MDSNSIGGNTGYDKASVRGNTIYGI